MRYIATFSGGKDSLDTIIWCENNLQPHEWDIVMCDTDWENELTYQHIDEIEAKTGKKITRLKHEPFPISDEERSAIRAIFGKDNVFAEMVVHKGRFPSTKARLCTEELKAKPMIDYVLSRFYDITVLQGVRNDESRARAAMKERDEFFKFYFEPYKVSKKGRKLYHTYAKTEVIIRCNTYVTDVFRPIIKKTAEQVFDSIYSNGYKPNPLYLMGRSRVGCDPCVMCKQEEISQVAIDSKARIFQIGKLEELTGSSFFPPGYIPAKYCTRTADVHLYVEDLLNTNKPNLYNPSLYNSLMESESVKKYEDDEGDVYVIKRMKVPTIKDVVTYVSENPDQMRLFEQVTGCVSPYNICER